MRLKRVLAGMITGVMLCGSVNTVVPYATTMKQVEAAENITTTLSDDKSIIFERKPMSYTCQKFYIDKVNKYLYATYKPVEGTKCHMLCRYILSENGENGWIATGESFMVLNKTGHGMILDGETKNNKTYLYVGCDANAKYEATGIARIDYDSMPKYVYNTNTKKWVYSGVVSKGKNKNLKSKFYDKKTDKTDKLTIDNVQKSNIDNKWKIKSFSSLLGSGESFVKADFCVASTGAHMVYVKYKKKKTNMMRVRKLQDVFSQIDNQIDGTSAVATFNAMKLKDNVVTSRKLSEMLGGGRSTWQATAAWTRYDSFFTTQGNVKKLKVDNTGLYINRRLGSTYQTQQTYKLNFSKNTDMLTSIEGKANTEKTKWPLEMEGIQVIKTGETSATIYVYIRGSKADKKEKIFYFNVTK